VTNKRRGYPNCGNPKVESMSQSLKELREQALKLGLEVQSDAREPYLQALRHFYLQRDYPAGLPFEELSPMHCFNYHALKQKEQRSIWNDPNFIAQEKLNGIRAILHFVRGIGVFAHVCKINDTNFRRTEITDWLLFANCIPSFSATLDCEITSEGGLQETIALLHTSPEESRRRQRDTPLLINCFDLTNWEGTDLRARRLEERLTYLPLLHTTLAAAGLSNHFSFPPTFRLCKKDVFERIINQGGEGCVLKNLDSPYRDNSSRDRTSWVKCKREVELTAFVSGFERGRPGTEWENKVASLVFSVNVTEGAYVIAKISALPWPFRKEISLYDRSTGSLNLEPELFGAVAVISGLELSQNARRLTHARIKHWRLDLNQTQCLYSWADLEQARLGATTLLLRITG
jgi:hypothetical protein